MSDALVVDDSKFQREKIKDVVESEGFDVYTAEGGTEALDIFDDKNPDVIFLDILIGDMDGLKVLDEIRKVDSEVTAGMVSGVSDKDAEEEAKERGADFYMSKPISRKRTKTILKDV
jgi:two-component system chemotaxis response regulator CheY